MSFKVTKNRTFTHEVKVMTPTDGGHKQETITATFNYIDVDEAAKHDLSTSVGTTSFLKAIVRKLDDITDEDGKPLPYNDELRDGLLQMNAVRQALYQHYAEAISKDPKAGN